MPGVRAGWARDRRSAAVAVWRDGAAVRVPADEPVVTAFDQGLGRGDGVFESVAVARRRHPAPGRAPGPAGPLRGAARARRPRRGRRGTRSSTPCSPTGRPTSRACCRLFLTRGLGEGLPPTALALLVPGPRRGRCASAPRALRGQPGPRRARRLPGARRPWLLGGAKTLSYAVNMAAQRHAHAPRRRRRRLHLAGGRSCSRGRPRRSSGPPAARCTPRRWRPASCRAPRSPGCSPAPRRPGWPTAFTSGTVADLHAADAVWLLSGVRGAATVHTLDGVRARRRRPHGAGPGAARPVALAPVRREVWSAAFSSTPAAGAASCSTARRTACSPAARGPRPAGSRDVLRKETVGGALLLAGAAASPWSGRTRPGRRRYAALRDTDGRARRRCTWTSRSAPGPPTGCWRSSSSSPGWSSSASSSPATCATRAGPRCRSPPRSAAWSCRRCSTSLVNLGTGDGALRGWAIPTATDIAFALAVLAVISTHLPSGAAHVPADPRRRRRPARDHDHRALLHRRRCRSAARCCWRCCRSRLFGAPGAAADPRRGGCCCRSPSLAWALVHASGVHATVAGVLLGFTVPVSAASRRRAGRRSGPGRALRAPVPADLGRLRRAGVRVLRRRRHHRRARPGWPTRCTDPVALGIVAGLVVGKTDRHHRGHLAGRPVHPRRARRRPELVGRRSACRCSAGIGFTVSLLIGELAFGAGSGRDDHVKVGVLVGSVTAALLAAVAAAAAQPRLPADRRRSRRRDDDHDGIPDVYQRPSAARR